MDSLTIHAARAYQVAPEHLAALLPDAVLDPAWVVGFGVDRFTNTHPAPDDDAPDDLTDTDPDDDEDEDDDGDEFDDGDTGLDDAGFPLDPR